MIGDTLEADLVAARAETESRMLDTCRITRPGERTWDEANGVYVQLPVVVYQGKCRIRHRTIGSAKAEAGSQLVTLSETEIHVPALIAGINVSDTVTITACPTRPDQVGREFTLAGLVDGSQMTALRYRVEVADAR